MNKLFAAVGLAAAVLAVPAAALAQQPSHHGGGYRGGGNSSSSSGGGYRDQGGAVRESGGGYRGGGYGGAGYRGGYGRGYGYGGYRGYGFYPYFGFGFSAAFFDPWYGGYPFYYGAPWYYDYLSGAPYPPPGVVNDPYGVPGSWVRDRYPDRPDSAWDRDYGSSYDRDDAAPSAGVRGASNAPCGQWVWNDGAKKYDWQAAGCAAPAGSAASARAGVDAPPLRVPPVS